MECEPEVYRFVWHSSFDGDVSVRIGREGDAITIRWVYERWLRAPAADDAPAEAALPAADWARFREALIAANFWALDLADERQGLDRMADRRPPRRYLPERVAMEPARQASRSRPAVLCAGRRSRLQAASRTAGLRSADRFCAGADIAAGNRS